MRTWQRWTRVGVRALRRSLVPRGIPATPPETWCEPLEPRQMLYTGPMLASLPPLSALESPTNTVVRILTNEGAIDLELFDTVAPNTVANFLNYIRAGRLDETFFYRAHDNLLRGGGIRYIDGVGLRNVPWFPPIANEFQRPNTARTVAMWKPPGQPNGATYHFLINIVDNPAFNTIDGGYTVFGRVIQGWNVVQAIVALPRRDLDLPLTGSNPNPGTFDAVPTRAGYNPAVGPTEHTLVKILDIEVIKPAGIGRYYTYSYVYPEGFRSASVTERIEIANIDNLNAPYQVIVRYETGDRDQVIAHGVLGPGRHLTVTTADAAIPGHNVVRAGVGYAIEVRAGRALAVSFHHTDFGAALGESFQMVAAFADSALRAWEFPAARRDTDRREFLVWQGLGGTDISVYVTLHHESGTVRYLNYPLKAFRRGGVALHTLNSAILAPGRYSIRVSATGPIVAALSTYKLGGSGDPSEGSTALGTMLANASEGYLAGAMIPTTGESHVHLFYTSSVVSAVIVDFQFFLSDGTSLIGPSVLLTVAQRRARVDLATAHPSLPRDQFFTIRYAVRNYAAPVSAHLTTEVAGDVMASPFQTAATRTVAFGDGFHDPAASMQEIISVFNPYASNVNFSYQLRFSFVDGTTIWAPDLPRALGPRRREDIRVSDLPAVMAKINSGPQFRFFSVEVISVQFTLPTPIGGVVAQRTRINDTSGHVLTSGPILVPPGAPAAPGTPISAVLFLNHPEFR